MITSVTSQPRVVAQRASAPLPAAAASQAAALGGDTLATTATHADGSLTASDGKAIAYRTTEPARKPRAIVVMQQGTYGQPALWDAMGEKLAAQGIKSYAVGSRVETTDSRIHADDLDRVVARARQENPGVPVTVMGVSLGAMIAMDWNASRNTTHTPVVLMSPVVVPRYLGAGDLLKVGAGLFSKHFAKSKVDSPMSKGAPLTTNPNSPELSLPNAKEMKVPANLFDDVVKMAARGAEAGGKTTGPLLVMEAGDDKVALNLATSPFMKLIGSKDKTVVKLPGAAHDLSQESQRPDVVNTLSNWVLKHSEGA